MIGIEKYINKMFGISCFYDLFIWFGDFKDVFFYLKLLYDIEKNKISVFVEFNLDLLEIRVIRYLNEKIYIML